MYMNTSLRPLVKTKSKDWVDTSSYDPFLLSRFGVSNAKFRIYACSLPSVT